MNVKYPKTPYWPYSPTIGREDEVHQDPQRFVGERVIVTEKLDGSNILIHKGRVYGRGVSIPSEDKWMGMVKKHHAWKVTEPNVYLYGEDIYGVHSISYDPVAENRTFYAFSLRDAFGTFASFSEMENYAERQEIPIVPVLFRGMFRTLEDIQSFIASVQGECSALGGEREGVVLRLACDFPESEFGNATCKSVRTHHVQSDQHWRRNWQPCKITRTSL